MKIIKVKEMDTVIIQEILNNLIDNSDEKEALPTKSHLKKLLNDDRSYLLAAIVDGKTVAYALAYRFPSLYTSTFLAYLYDIEVLEAYRRKGIGRMLIENLKIYLKADGVDELWLGTAIDNQEGQGLFSATGARKSGETFNDYTYFF